MAIYFYNKWIPIKRKNLCKMTEETSAYDRERLTHINYLMDNIHDSTTHIYESLVDRDFDTLQEHIKNLQLILKDISISVEDDI